MAKSVLNAPHFQSEAAGAVGILIHERHQMASDQENAPPTLEVLKVDTISVSNGILSVPLRVYVRGSVAPDGDVVLILQAEFGQDLSKIRGKTA